MSFERYVISDTPVSDLTLDELRTESDALKEELRAIESELGMRKAQHDAGTAAPDYLTWVGRAKAYLKRLQGRYVKIKVALRSQDNGGFLKKFVTREEFEALKEQVAGMKKKTDTIPG